VEAEQHVEIDDATDYSWCSISSPRLCQYSLCPATTSLSIKRTGSASGTAPFNLLLHADRISLQILHSLPTQLRSLNLACDKALVFSSENVANLLGNSSTDPPLSSIKVYNQSNWLERNWYANMGSALTTILNILLQEDKNETFTTTYDVYVKVDSDTWVHPSYFRRLFDPYAMRLRNEVLSLTVGDDFYGSDSKFDGYFNAHSRKALLYLSPWISRQSCLALEILGGHREVEFEGGAPNGCKEETKEENKMLIPPHLFSLGSRGICDCTV